MLPSKLLLLLAGTAIIMLSRPSPGVTSAILSALHAGNYSEARRLLTGALKTSPGDARLWTLNGLALDRLGNKPHALSSYNHALRISPDYLPALEGAAEIDFKTGSPNAVPLLKHILQLRPNDETSHAMLASIAFKHGDCAAAESDFKKSESLIESQVPALEQRAACLVALGKPNNAIPVLQRLASLEPGNERALYNLAVAEDLAGRYQDVIATLAPAVKQNPSDADGLDLLAEAYEHTSDTPRAVAALREAIVTNPDVPRYYVHFSDICLAHASFQVGVDMLDAGLKRMPDSAPLYLARGILYVQMGRYDAAQADFNTAEQLDPHSRNGSEAQGLAELQQNNLPQAEATIRERLRHKPNDAFLNYLLAETLARKGAAVGTPEFKQAVEAASRAVQLDPHFALARDVLGRFYLQEGKIEDAIEQSRMAYRADPGDQTALYHLILALRKGNKTAEVPDLMKQLAQLREQARRKEISERKYAIVEQKPQEK